MRPTHLRVDFFICAHLCNPWKNKEPQNHAHPHHNYLHPNNLRSCSQLAIHYSQLRRSRHIQARVLLQEMRLSDGNITILRVFLGLKNGGFGEAAAAKTVFTCVLPLEIDKYFTLVISLMVNMLRQRNQYFGSFFKYSS